ncbi:unnamed protein product [Mytilus edulis]|uniref:Uncharacterized protein n=1 Tax=Mytilus edulis TaxID=6550 RepID=A0A8S3U5L1_MYTED|nr:unnamed protein product [Mytilus edulis]
MGRVTISDKADRLIEYKDRQEEKIKQTIYETNQIGGKELLQHSEDKLPDETTRDLITMQPKFDNQTHTPHLIFKNPETLLTLGDCEAQNMTAIPTQLNGMECGTILQKIKLPVEDNNLVFGAENSAFIDSSLNHSCFQGHEPSLPGERIEVHSSSHSNHSCFQGHEPSLPCERGQVHSSSSSHNSCFQGHESSLPCERGQAHSSSNIHNSCCQGHESSLPCERGQVHSSSSSHSSCFQGHASSLPCERGQVHSSETTNHHDHTHSCKNSLYSSEGDESK